MINIDNCNIIFSNKLIKEYSSLNHRFKSLDDIYINAKVTLYENAHKENVLFQKNISRNTLMTFFVSYKALTNNTLKFYLIGMKMEVFSEFIESNEICQLLDNLSDEEFDKKYNELFNTVFIEFNLSALNKGHINLKSSELLTSLYEDINNITENYETEDILKFINLLEEDLETEDEFLELNKLKSYLNNVKK
ncbi:hypothetical protein [Terrisporobacter petrolearius]|uniref:hypothetical protein n=1 Tax=Terrisporobacter petrolearius TaxID=1460447 RepID=UPI0031CC9B8E